MIEPLACSNQFGLALGSITSKGPIQWGEPPAKPEPIAPVQEPVVQEGPNPMEDWRTPISAEEIGIRYDLPSGRHDKYIMSKPRVLGVRVYMKDGSMWYRHEKTQCWTRTRLADPVSISKGMPHTIKEEPIPHRKLVRDALAGQWPGRKLLDALNWGLDHAKPWAGREGKLGFRKNPGYVENS